MTILATVTPIHIVKRWLDNKNKQRAHTQHILWQSANTAKTRRHHKGNQITDGEINTRAKIINEKFKNFFFYYRTHTFITEAKLFFIFITEAKLLLQKSSRFLVYSDTQKKKWSTKVKIIQYLCGFDDQSFSSTPWFFFFNWSND